MIFLAIVIEYYRLLSDISTFSRCCPYGVIESFRRNYIWPTNMFGPFASRYKLQQLCFYLWCSRLSPFKTIFLYQAGLATASDLAAFRLSMIAPVKKSVNHWRTVASMCETGWEQQQEVRLRSFFVAIRSTVWREFAFGPVGHCFLCCNQFLSAVMWSLRFSFFWSCVCHDMRFTTLRTRPVNIDRSKQTLSFWLTSSL